MAKSITRHALRCRFCPPSEPVQRGSDSQSLFVRFFLFAPAGILLVCAPSHAWPLFLLSSDCTARRDNICFLEGQHVLHREQHVLLSLFCSRCPGFLFLGPYAYQIGCSTSLPWQMSVRRGTVSSIRTARCDKCCLHRGLQFLHKKCDIIHTDVKPENVLLTLPLGNADGNGNDIAGEPQLSIFCRLEPGCVWVIFPPSHKVMTACTRTRTHKNELLRLYHKEQEKDMHT